MPHPSTTIRLSTTSPRVAAVDCLTVERRLRTHGPLPLERSLDIAAQLLDFLTGKPPGYQLHPASIVIASPHKVELLQESTAAGSAASLAFPYMAPEVLRGAPAGDSASTYSVGVILFQMLTGVLPFHAPHAYAMLRRQLEEPPPSLAAFLPNSPSGLDEVLRIALAGDPAHRYHTPRQFRDALDPFLPSALMQTRITRAMPHPKPVPAPLPMLPEPNFRSHWIALLALFLASALYLALTPAPSPDYDPIGRHPLPFAYEN